MAISSPDQADASSVARRLEAVRNRIAQACRAAGRDPDGVVLTAVTKTQPSEAVDAILAAGQRVFGENRVQEAQARWADRRAAVALFDVIETLDRPRLADALATASAKAGKPVRVLVQINTGAEPQKAGALPAEADALIAHARSSGLTVEGLMCIPPAEEAPGIHFALLRKIARRNGLEVLSMGMSGDYETAIRFGATHVRVGSALFGERNTPETPSMD